MLGGEAARGRFLRVTPAVLLPLFFVLIPLIQIMPLPVAVVSKIDPAGAALLADSPVGEDRCGPSASTRVETRAVVARSAAVLAVFLVAFHLASGRSRRQLLIRIVAASSVAAVAIGLGHRMLGEAQIYGHFRASRGLLNGPFINSNHTAEFLELGAFVCVACALAGASALNRVGWLTAAVMAGAGALGALSRGAIAGAGRRHDRLCLAPAGSFQRRGRRYRSAPSEDDSLGRYHVGSVGGHRDRARR